MEYRIGDFAIITRLTVKTLRYYHEEELLKPSRIALDTGYRYYNSDLIYIARIKGTLRTWECFFVVIPENMLLKFKCLSNNCSTH